MKVVFDTNVLISAFLWQKGLKPIYQAIRSGDATPCFTQATWAELLRVLSYKKFERQLLNISINPAEIARLIASKSYFTISRYPVTAIKDDPSDNEILACAIFSGASFIISGDKHLLTLEFFHDIPILTPRDFLPHLR